MTHHPSNQPVPAESHRAACVRPEPTEGCGFMRAVYSSCHMMMRVFDRAVQHEGLTGSRWHLLGVVRDSDTPLTITQLSECLFLSPQNVSRMIAALESEGLVTRDTSGPGRTVRVRLTEVGTVRVDNCAALAERCAENMLRDIGPDEIRHATGVLERMMGNTVLFEKELDQARAASERSPANPPASPPAIPTTDRTPGPPALSVPEPETHE